MLAPMGHRPDTPRDGFRFEDVTLEADSRRILDHITMTVACEGITVLAGPSGAGKSTMLRLCNRLDVPSSGRVLLDGADLAELEPTSLRRRVGMVFQRPVLFGGTVRDNLRVADPGADDRRCTEVLARVALGEAFLDRHADDLSGGEAQRMCLARTLLTGPELVLMDEPTSALDPESRHQIEQLAGSLAAEGIPIIWVTHDLEQLERIANRTVVLIDGRLVEGAEAQRYLVGDDAGSGQVQGDSPGEVPGEGECLP